METDLGRTERHADGAGTETDPQVWARGRVRRGGGESLGGGTAAMGWRERGQWAGWWWQEKGSGPRGPHKPWTSKEEPRAGARGPPFPPDARWWVSKGDTGSGHPQGSLTAWEGCRGQVPSSSWKVGCPPSSPLPVFLGGHPPNLTHPSTHGGRQSAPPLCSPLPAPPTEAQGGRWEARWKSNHRSIH